MPTNLTPNFNRYIKQLSYKLRDPVASQEGLGDGKLFSLALKQDYLNRAYADLKMTLSSIVSGIERIFPDFYKVISYNVISNTGIEPPAGTDTMTAPTTPSTVKLKNLQIALSTFGLDEKVFEIKDLYVSVLDSGTSYVYKQANQIIAENYYGALYGASTVYKANDNAFKFFYSIVNGKIVFTGGDKVCNQVTLFIENTIPQFESNGTVDIVIPKFYEKLYLTLAAIEAMLDKGDNEAITKVVAYSKTVQQILELIAVREKTIVKREIDKTR